MQEQLDSQRQKVDVDNYTITVRELISMTSRKELHRAPEYQRKFRWDEEAESRLIESILLGLPIPSVFFATNDDGSWEVVDGLQRISTLIHFAAEDLDDILEVGKEEPLVLSGLRKLDAFNGYSFTELPMPIRLNFLKRGVGVTALSDKSDRNTRFDTFERLNRGAVALTPQEVRACIYQGEFNDLLRELGNSERFRKLVKLPKQNEENATREELVLKFFAYLHDRESFSGSVYNFLNNYMEKERVDFDVAAGRELFFSVVDALLHITGGYLLRRNTNRTPQNQLEAVMVGCAEVLQQHGRVGQPPTDWLSDEELVRASTGSTNTPGRLRDRIKRSTELLKP